MKSTTAYYLLLLYITVMIKPLMPYMQDEWNHQFNEIEHVSIVHAKYGSHHLQKELANSTADKSKSKDQNTVRFENQIPFHILLNERKIDLCSITFNKKYYTLKFLKPSSVFINRQGPPPKFS